ncbi:DUF2169 family type VI secretion system accessory protein [Acanthopleuribacter pedis]|uniref:DUF2169 domain-containing protein n=1 Tax=Acanthopleuribacter pedis TaxID=442870 RepID=A0A8J7Q2C8_9BACT|nr:DUF2169 domain-containing protein [Acanthopleuribacter pedis]MBO1319252.1 DUF2169 domain-containing protein [Acanthopleuribacter pedis]
MLQIVNQTPLATGFSFFTDKTGAERVTLVVKAQLNLPADGEAVSLHPDPCEVLVQDLYHGEPGQSSLHLAGELVMEKTATDVALVGSAVAPGGIAVPQMPVSLTIGAQQHRLLVSGDRTWKQDLSGATEPVPFETMPITYERAFGGTLPPVKEDQAPAYCPENPVGTGFATKRAEARGAALPNIETIDQPLTHWQQKPPVAGFGFIDTSWQPRMALVGTYDETWQRNKAPLLPDDFNPDYFNAAHPDLIHQPFLQGGERVILDGFHADGPRTFTLPQLQLSAAFNLAGSKHPTAFDLWQVVFHPNQNRFTMAWGAGFAFGKMPSRLREVVIVDRNQFFAAAPSLGSAQSSEVPS